MNKLSLNALNSYAGFRPNPAEEWVRVQLDTGGIAAGAEETMRELQRAAARISPSLVVSRAGSYGYAYADPVVEIQTSGMPRALYGRVSPELAAALLERHLIGRQLSHDHLICQRSGATEIKEPVTHLLVLDTCDEGARTAQLQASLEQELEKHGLKERVPVVRALELGVHGEGATVRLLPSGVTYTKVLDHDLARIVAVSVGEQRVLADLLSRGSDRQQRITLRNCGSVDPEDLEDCLRRGQSYQALAKVLSSMDAAAVIEELKQSGLRGRGGAGFPTWMKWMLTRQQPAEQRYVICNGDEGDPGAFMDRSVLESDPHAVLEGMMIAGYAMGASMGYFYIRAEYPKAVARIERAIEQAREAGLLGDSILGSGFSFNAKVRLGAGAFVCGEETALIASMEGRRGSPSPRPPYPSVRGLWGSPTAINNVETLALVPAILLKGGAWHASYGTEASKGTKVFAVTGKVKRPQLVEVPMGTTLREIVFGICGGVLPGSELKAVQTGGPSGGMIPEAELDTPISYEALQQLGSIVGSGGLIVMDTADSMVDVAKFYLRFCMEESCGKCAPCRIGSYQMLQILERISRGRGKPEDLVTLRRICLSMQKASLCGLGQTAPNPVLSGLRFFESEYEAYIEGGPSYARRMSQPSASTGQQVAARGKAIPSED
jgi:NADP-reducing hydrogenase subunit HndC